MLRRVWSGLKWIGAAVAAIIALSLGALWIDIIRANANYAERVFGGAVAYDAVIASRRYFGLFSGFGCTYAIVRLPTDADDAPPSAQVRLAGHDGFHAYGPRHGLEWQPTPSGLLAEPGGDGQFVTCKATLGADLFGDLQQAADLPGGWWAQSGDSVSVYSPPTGLAFLMREGD